jgi:methylated-DNA-[protein]-cysteine S-methyltransferase
MDFSQQIQRGQIHSGMTFQQKVWALTRRIPAGKVVTYGDIARELDSRAYRAVGRALHCNPYAPQVPCHRVVGSTGQLTGFAGGLAKKEKLLASEGVAVRGSRVDDLPRHRHSLSA